MMTTTATEASGFQVPPKQTPPYRVDAERTTVQTISPGKQALVGHVFGRLDSENAKLLYDREEKIIRKNESMGRNRARSHSDSYEADTLLYNGLVKEGWWVPYSEPEADRTPLDYQTVLRFTQERKSEAVQKLLDCTGFVVPEGNGIDWMFEASGSLTVLLKIGDVDEPAYNLGIRFAKPRPEKRRGFKDSFSYQVEDRSGDLPIVSTVINLRKGVELFDSHFAGIATGAYKVMIAGREEQGVFSDVVFKAAEGQEGAEEAGVRPYSESDAQEFLRLFNPACKVEVAATVGQFYKKTEGKS